MPDYKIGDRVWIRWLRGHTIRREGAISERIITKIGRRWVEVVPEDTPDWGVDRFDIKTLRVDGGTFSSPGDVYFTYQDALDVPRRQELMRDIRTRSWGELRHITTDQLQAFVDLLDNKGSTGGKE